MLPFQQIARFFCPTKQFLNCSKLSLCHTEHSFCDGIRATFELFSLLKWVSPAVAIKIKNARKFDGARHFCMFRTETFSWCPLALLRASSKAMNQFDAQTERIWILHTREENNITQREIEWLSPKNTRAIGKLAVVVCRVCVFFVQCQPDEFPAARSPPQSIETCLADRRI